MEMKSKYRILIAAAIFPFVVTGVFLIFLPDQVPMHYNARGELDRMGSKYENLLLPVLYLIPAALLFFLAKQQRKKQEYRNENVLVVAGILIQLMQTVLLLITLVNDLTYNGPSDQPPDIYKLAGIGIGVLLIVLGNVMPKAARNALFGLRTVWSMKNDRVWQHSQRFAGYTGIFCGFLMVLAGIFFNQAVVLGVVTGLLLVWLAVCTAASYRFYKTDLQLDANNLIKPN